MADDKTQTLNGGSFEERVLAQFAAIDNRLGALEQKVEERSRDTRHLFEQAIREMQQTRSELGDRLTAVEKEMRLLGRKIDVFGEDLTRARVEVRDLDARVNDLEQKPA